MEKLRKIGDEEDLLLLVDSTENAERAKAAWNATLGYTTEHLEELGDLKTVSDEKDRKTKELEQELKRLKKRHSKLMDLFNRQGQR